MTNIKALDKDSYAIEIASDGNGSPSDPFVPHHKVVSSALPLGAAVEARQIEQLVRTQELTAAIEDLRDLLQILIDLSGTVNVGNFPTTQLVTGTVGINNFPTIQPVSGTVGINNFPAIQPVSGTVGINNFPAIQPVSGTVGINNFPAIQPVSGTVGINNFPATQSIIDSQITYIESAIPLAANGSFSGVGRDGQNKNTVRGWIWTNSNGNLYIDQSTNNINWRQVDAFSVNGSTTQATSYMFRLFARYYRLRYVNGNSAQSTFELISTVFGIGL